MTQQELQKLNLLLCNASSNGNLEVVNRCLEDGADVHSMDDFSLASASINGHIKVVRLLLKHGASFKRAIRDLDEYNVKHIKKMKQYIEAEITMGSL